MQAHPLHPCVSIITHLVCAVDLINNFFTIYHTSYCIHMHMENEIDQYYMDLADDYHHEHVVGYLSSEFPSLKRKVSHNSLH